MKKHIKKLSLFIVLSILLFPNLAKANIACPAGITITSVVCNIGNVIGTVATAAVIIFWLLTGVLFLTAQGDPTKLGTAKKALFGAIGGTIVVVVARFSSTIIYTAITTGF